MKRLYLVLALLLAFSTIIMALTGCGDEASEDDVNIKTVSTTISIDYPVKSDLEDVEDVELNCKEGSTVLDMLQLYCATNDTPITVELLSSKVQGINNVLEGEYGSSRSWYYSLNNKDMGYNTDKKIKDGDSIMWSYGKYPK